MNVNLEVYGEVFGSSSVKDVFNALSYLQRVKAGECIGIEIKKIEIWQNSVLEIYTPLSWLPEIKTYQGEKQSGWRASIVYKAKDADAAKEIVDNPTIYPSIGIHTFSE